VSEYDLLVDHREPDVGVVELKGEHDEFTAPKLARELQLLIERGLHVVVDLRGTTFLGASNVGVVLSAWTSAAKQGRRLVLLLDDSTGPAVRRLFELTRLGSIVPAFTSRAGALAAIRGSERRSGAERRSARERRTRSEHGVVVDRRSGEERRSGLDRRASGYS
jgi:anti-anti-sigma factor